MKRLLLMAGVVMLLGSGCSKYQQLIGLGKDDEPKPDKGYDSTQWVHCCDPMRGIGTEILCQELKTHPNYEMITIDRVRVKSDCTPS